MTERPILMTAPEVRSLLAGTKTQHRVPMKPQPPAGTDITMAVDHSCACFRPAGSGGPWLPGLRNPHGSRFHGDRLWVRETWCLAHPEYELQAKPDVRPQQDGKWCLYRATEQDVDFPDGGGWKPSIHMPRWACRLVLELTGVRVQRLGGPGMSSTRSAPWQRNPWVWVLEVRPMTPQKEDPRAGT